MNILIQNMCGSAHSVQAAGLANALTYCGHKVYTWNSYLPGAQQLLDIFYEFKPDVFYTQSYALTRDHLVAAAKYPDVKWILMASAFGPILKEAGPEFEILRVTEKEKKNVSKLRDATKSDITMIIHHTPKTIDRSMSGWSTLGMKYESVLLGCDTFSYGGGKYRPDLDCDIAFCGSAWKYKLINISKYLFPVLDKYKVKVFGSAWDIPNCLGNISLENERDLYASCKIAVNMSEPHSTEWGFDVNERNFKTGLSGQSLSVCDHVEGLKEIYPEGSLVVSDGPEDFAEQINYYLTHEEERLSRAAKHKEAILAGQTYFHRVEKLFRSINLNDEANDIINKYSEYLVEYRSTHE